MYRPARCLTLQGVLQKQQRYLIATWVPNVEAQGCTFGARLLRTPAISPSQSRLAPLRRLTHKVRKTSLHLSACLAGIPIPCTYAWSREAVNREAVPSREHKPRGSIGLALGIARLPGGGEAFSRQRIRLSYHVASRHLRESRRQDSSAGSTVPVSHVHCPEMKSLESHHST